MIALRMEAGAVLLPVKVVPGASRTRFMGELDGRAKFAVAAAPEQGKANAALIAHVARLLGLRRQNIMVVQGTTTPVKTLRIAGATADDVRQILETNPT